MYVCAYIKNTVFINLEKQDNENSKSNKGIIILSIMTSYLARTMTIHSIWHSEIQKKKIIFNPFIRGFLFSI